MGCSLAAITGLTANPASAKREKELPRTSRERIMAATLTIYGVQTHYDRETKRTDSEPRKLEIELSQLESWRAPIGFNVTEIKADQ